MARKQEVIVHLVDDLDGTVAAETVAFTIDGSSYEIDLNKRNAKSIRSDFDKWTAHARKAKGKARTTRRRTAGSAPAGLSEAATVRAWATSNGVEVPARGRIPKTVLEAFHAAS